MSSLKNKVTEGVEKDLAVETVDKLKHAAGKVAEKPPSDREARSPKADANKTNKSN